MMNTFCSSFADNSLGRSNISLPLHPRCGSISISRLLRHRHGKLDAMAAVVAVAVEAVVDQVGPGPVQSARGEMTTAAAVATSADNSAGIDRRRCTVVLLF